MKKCEKLTWKLLLTVMVFGVLLATWGKAQAASWVEINEKNFPDKASREYLIGNSETQSENFKERNGKYYVNVSGVTELYRGPEDQTIKDTDFLKKFKRLSSLGITTSDSTVKLPASVKSVMIEFKGKCLNSALQEQPSLDWMARIKERVTIVF